MSERKPPGLDFESWIERRIREASDRGAFEDLPGKGEPIADLDRPHDENWWIKQKLRSEGLSYVPPALALRKRARDARAAALAAASEEEARRILEEVNEEIRWSLRKPTRDLQPDVAPFDVDRVVRAWRERRAG